jgi:hypothetical protein
MSRRVFLFALTGVSMAQESPKHLLIVKQPRGLIVRDTPRAESEGSIRLRTEAVGKQLQAYSIHNISGVPYARLVPQNPTKPEWVRVKEADGSIEYVDVINLEEVPSGLAEAVHHLARAIEAHKAQ